MKALEILKEHKYSLDCLVRTDVVSHLLKQTNEAIAELEALELKESCDNCKHLPNKEENLKHSCLIEVCRTCCRDNNDNWELKQ